MSLEKDSLKKAVSNYNERVGESSKVVLENIENGEFPWHVTDGSLNDSGTSNIVCHIVLKCLFIVSSH